MKAIPVILFVILFSAFTVVNAPVSKVDLRLFSGKWYSLYSIPTMFDKGSRETTTTYTMNRKGYIDVKTTYKKPSDEAVYSVASKMFTGSGYGGGLKAQFIWPIKVDYWIIELPADYSYAVIGHPEHKFLFIMSRNKTISDKIYQEILERCKSKGYDVNSLTSQGHSN